MDTYCNACDNTGQVADGVLGLIPCRACNRGDPQTNGKAPVSVTPATSTSGQPTRRPPSDLFRRWSMAELLAELDSFSWLIQGLLAEPTYGQIAGEMKTLKTYVSAMIQIGLAAGVPILDRFIPPEPRPVLAYVGEGGRRPYRRRLCRVAESMGVSLLDIPLFVSTDVAPIQSPMFAESLARDLAEVGPALVSLDPFYAYHGTASKASDLHQEGALLSGLSARCLDAGASLMVVNHMNQSGAGMDLKRITMAGSGEWVDTWMLIAHRQGQPADVDAGRFALRLEVGSRQWGGTRWDLDLNIGRFDPDAGAHDGPITWNIHPAATGGSGPADDRHSKTRQAILDVLSDRPGITRTDIRELVKVSHDRFKAAFDALADDGYITHDKPRIDPVKGGRPAPRWYIAEVSSQATGTEGDEEEAF